MPTVTLPTPEALIAKILAAVSLEQVLDPTNIDDDYRAVVKIIHPDLCHAPGADEANQHLNDLRDIYTNGKEFRDELGPYRTNGWWAKFTSAEPALQWSFENYNNFLKLKDLSDLHFQFYLPSAAQRVQNNGSIEIRLDFAERAIPLHGLQLEQKHVMWILNRLLSYAAYLETIGWVHCGLTPESVFIVPSTHGIQVCSFYHLTRTGKPVGTIAAEYKHWYPTHLFVDKIATGNIDAELSKKLALYLLGDPSGAGVKLRGKMDARLIDFILTHHSTAYDAYMDYKHMLDTYYKREFHILNI